MSPTRQDVGDSSALSDEARAALKSALAVLGVSHDGLIHNNEEHNVFMLGLDAEDLREVVCVGVCAFIRCHGDFDRFFSRCVPRD